MNLSVELMREHSKSHATKIANYVLKNNQFDDLMDIFFNSNYRLNQRSAYVMNICYEKQHKIIQPYIKKLVENLHQSGLHDAVKRNTVRILQFIQLPDNLIGEVADICFKYLISKDEPIAVKAFSMRVLANICKTYPELKNELIPIIEDMIPHGSPGIKNRGKKILKELQK